MNTNNTTTQLSPSIQDMPTSRKSAKSFSQEVKKHIEMLNDIRDIGLIIAETNKHPETYTNEKDEFIKNALTKWPRIVLHKKALEESIHDRQKEKMINSLSRKALDSINTATSVMSYISDKQIQLANKEKQYQEILDLTRKAKRSKRRQIELKALYDRNRSYSATIIEDKVKKLEQKYFGQQYQNIKAIEISDKKDKEIILERIYAGRLAKGDHELFRLISRLKQGILFLKDNLLFDPELAIQIRSSDRLFTKRVALAIHKPHYLSHSYMLCDVKFSNKLIESFSDDLPIANIIDIFLIQESGHDISELFVEKYKSKSGHKEIKNLVKSEYLCKPFSQIIDNNKQSIHEMLSCYKKSLPYPTTCALLSIIEGVIWSFADFLDTISIKIFSYNEHHEIKSIVNASDGSENPNITIGTLLNISHVNQYINKKFLEYFCNELYRERNNILHGDTHKPVNMQNTSEKMAVLEYLLDGMNKHIKKFWTELYTNSVSSEYLDTLAKHIHK